MRYGADIGYESEPHVHGDQQLRPLDDALEYLRAYARERPEVMALIASDLVAGVGMP